MKRTKKKPIVRTKARKPKLLPHPSNGLGGHIPNPPKDCPAPRIRRGGDDTIYIDCTSCTEDKCDYIKKCKRRHEFKVAWKHFRAQERKENGHEVESERNSR